MKRILNTAALLVNTVLTVFFIIMTASISPSGEAGAVGIIGGADGPTAIYLASEMADPFLFSCIATGVLILYQIVFIINMSIRKDFL